MFNLLPKLRKVLPLWKSLSSRRRRQLVGLQVLSIVSALSEVSNLGALQPLLRLFADPKEGIKEWGPLATPLSYLPEKNILIIIGLGFITLVLISTILRVTTVRGQFRLAGLITADLGEKVFLAVLQKPFVWHLDNNSSLVLGRITEDVTRSSSIINACLSLLVNSTIVIFLGISLIVISPVVMISLSLLLLLFYWLIFVADRRKLRLEGQRVTTNYQASLQVAQEALGGIRDLLIDQSQNYYAEVFRNKTRNHRLAISNIKTMRQTPRYKIEGFSIILIVGLSLTLASRGEAFDEQLPLIGTLTLGAYRLLRPMQQCFSSIGGVIGNQASLERIEPFLIKTESVQEFNYVKHKSLPSLMKSQPLLELQNLSFRYNNDSPDVLINLNLAIKKGERIGFVGSTGSGKSTTSDLILGLLQPTKGRLIVHGVDLHSDSGLVFDWQKLVSHVPQSIYLSDASFASNIAFGIPLELIDFNRVKYAAEQAMISEIIEKTPKGYSTVVGERGVKLSGGQRQRIGLARAIYKKAELLVLDEATSALDNQTEEEVMRAIESLDRKITIITIAHRLSTIQNCDRIILLEDGKISGVGSYTDLLYSNESFRKLARINI